MADTFYGVSLGAKGPADVTVGASTSGLAIELRVLDGATGLTGNRTEVLKALKAIEYSLIERSAPA